METDIYQKIRTRVRKLSSTHSYSDLTPRQLQLICHLQSYWRMTVVRKQFQKRLKRKEKRKFILMELEKTEKDYIDDIRIVINHVMKEVQGFLDDQEMFNMLFINLEEIIEIHQKFYDKLAEALKNYNHHTTKISELILYLTPRLKDPYYTFCLEYSKSHQILRLLNISNTQFKTHINNLRKNGLLRGELASYLIKPVQRICKYSLLLRQLIKNTEEDHSDYCQLQKANDAIKNIVQGTNDKIQQFLCQERMNQLGSMFSKLQKEDNKFVYETRAGLIEKQGEENECDVYIFSKFIIMAQDRKQLLRFPLDENSTVKDNPTGKYFKNTIVVTSKKKLLTLSFPNATKKIQLLQALNKSLSQSQDQNRIDVDIEGAQEREQSMFSKFTVYIVRIKTKGIDMKIFPRFSQLMDLQKEIRKEIKNIDIPHLEKDNWLAKKLKTKTIEKRMFLIRDFLLNILNDPKVRNVARVFTELGLDLLLETSIRKKQDSQSNTISVTVSIAGWQQLNVWISQKSKIIDLKNKIVGLLNLQHPQQYELFVMKDKMKKLIYEDQMVTKILKQCGGGFFSKIFQDKILVFHRSCYLSQQEELELYKRDPVRTNLEMEIIKSGLQQFKLDYELLMTILALFAKHMNVQISSDNKIKAFLSSLKYGNLDHLIFREYCYEIQEVVKHQPTPIPLIIAKTINKSDLYTASQYSVEAYPKTLKEVRKEIFLEQNMILAVKPSKIIFLTSQREPIYVLQFQSIKELLVYPTSIVFMIDKIKNQIRFNTVQSYQISKLINLYTKSSLDTKHFNYRTSIE